MGIHEAGNLLSLDCISGDGIIMELELNAYDPRVIRPTGVEGVIVVRNDHETLAIIELDQARIDRLRAFLRGERDGVAP